MWKCSILINIFVVFKMVALGGIECKKIQCSVIPVLHGEPPPPWKNETCTMLTTEVIQYHYKDSN